MAIDKTTSSFKEPLAIKVWVYAPLVFFSTLKTVVELRNTYKIVKK
tara:strand:+ start:303 stop:440 length:138 start_codon:yes stop_codon:yes gene_type:complete